MTFEWDLAETVDEFIELCNGEIIDVEDGCLQDNYLLAVDGFQVTVSHIFGDEIVTLPSGMVMVTEKYLNEWSSGQHAIFSDEGNLWDLWQGLMEEIRGEEEE